MQKLKRWVAGALAALLLVAVPARSLAVVAYADAAGATVTVAAAAGGGGLGAAAVGSVAAGVVAGALLALGVRAFVSGADAAGMTKTQYIGSLMEQWSQTEYDNAQQLADDVAYSTYVTSDGVLHIKEAAAKKIKAFGDWLIGGGNAESVPVYGTTPSDYAAVDGYQIYPFTSDMSITFHSSSGDGNTYTLGRTMGAPVYVFSGYITSSTYPSTCLVSLKNFECIRNGIEGQYWASGTGPYFREFRGTSTTTPTLFNDPYPYAAFMAVTSFKGDAYPLVVPSDGIVGNPVDWAENQDVIDLGKPDAGDITLNPDVLPNLDITGELTATQDLVISLQDYIQSLIDVINGYRDKVIELTDALTGEKVGTADLPDIETLDPSITVPLNPEISIPDDAIGVIDGEIPAPPPPVPPGDKIIADYSYDLTSVFPFCIPFDIVRALSLLNAEPEAPKASFTWDIPLVGLNYTMEFDLAPWSGVAQVLRTMELLLFTIGLGLVTRKLIMA